MPIQTLDDIKKRYQLKIKKSIKNAMKKSINDAVKDIKIKRGNQKEKHETIYWSRNIYI